MARVVLMPPFAGEFFGGRGELEVEARSIFELVRLLGELAPGFAEAAPLRAAMAVDGAVASDWSVALGSASEVTVFPRVAGG